MSASVAAPMEITAAPLERESVLWVKECLLLQVDLPSTLHASHAYQHTDALCGACDDAADHAERHRRQVYFLSLQCHPPPKEKKERPDTKMQRTLRPRISLNALHRTGKPSCIRIYSDRLREIFPGVVCRSLSTSAIAASGDLWAEERLKGREGRTIVDVRAEPSDH